MPASRPKTKPKAIRQQTVDDIAGEHDVDPETVRRWIRRGCPATTPGRGRPSLMNSAEVEAWKRENHVTGQPGRSSQSDSPDLDTARLRKENALASKYELQVERERGELVATSDVKLFTVRALGMFRNKVRGIPASVSPLLEGRDGAERETIIARRLDECLNDLAESLSELCRGASATSPN